MTKTPYGMDWMKNLPGAKKSEEKEKAKVIELVKNICHARHIGMCTTCGFPDQWSKQQECKFAKESKYTGYCTDQMIGNDLCKSYGAQEWAKKN